ncbi:MAG: hypothetical protein GTO63_37140 [Anaerolineae bacterium]|nr:hypothetical protein [Anaerolineae bacterium]
MESQGQIQRRRLQHLAATTLATVIGLLPILTLLVLATIADAEGVSPAARSYHAMAYDASADRIILFGGWTEDSNGETWTYDVDTNTWNEMSPATAPTPRDSHAMAYDAKSSQVVLFGGVRGFPGTFNGETWIYDTASDTWTNMAPLQGPSPRIGAGMVYDSRLDQMILFGGHNTRCYGDTWAYDLDSNTWTEMTPENPPGPRAWQALAYDTESGRVVMFGGDSSCSPGSHLGDTWTYDLANNNWQSMNPTEAPPSRAHSGATYDSKSDRVVLSGGDGGPDETWVYDLNGNVWAQATTTTGPSDRMAHAMVYDEQSDLIVLFGGSWPPGLVTSSSVVPNDETWTYDLEMNSWTQVSPTGPAGLPPWVIPVLAVSVAAIVVVLAVALWRRRGARQPPPPPR